MAAHPGVAVTELVARGPGLDSPQGRQWASNRANLQTAAQGAIPTLYAATAPTAQGGVYYGPTGPNEIAGPLGLAAIPAIARDLATSIDGAQLIEYEGAPHGLFVSHKQRLAKDLLAFLKA